MEYFILQAEILAYTFSIRWGKYDSLGHMLKTTVFFLFQRIMAVLTIPFLTFYIYMYNT